MDYEVTFTKGSRIFKVVATPVIDGKDLAAAQKIYDKKFGDYQAKLTERKEAEEKARKEYEARVKQMEAEMQKAIAERKIRDSLYVAQMSKTELIYRTFTVSQFGFYNCDCPRMWPTGANVTASLSSEDGGKIHINNINLVEKSRNAVFPYQTDNGECSQFKFNPSKDNMIWAVTSDNKLAIVDVESFKAQQGRSGKVQFKFKVIDKEFKSTDDVKKYLEI